MKIVKITGKVELLSGLHIGGGDDTMKIGGIDNSVIKHANGREPYIPGSSLKGKMRSLLEWNCKLVGHGDGTPFNSKLLTKVPDPDKGDAETLLTLFGDKEGECGITRISVGDCNLSEGSKGLELSEAKYENTIDRQKGTAAHPRQSERVPAGVSFDFDIRVKVLDGDDEETLISMVKQGLSLVENDYLGGSGSRGYGRVQFNNVEVN